MTCTHVTHAHPHAYLIQALKEGAHARTHAYRACVRTSHAHLTDLTLAGVGAPGTEIPKLRGFHRSSPCGDCIPPPRRQRELHRHHREPRICPSHAPTVHTQSAVVRASRRPTSRRPELRLLVERCLACGQHLTTDTCAADPYPTAYRWGHEPGWAELDLEPADRCPDCGVRRDQAHHHDCIRAYCEPCDDWIFDCPHGACDG